VGGPPGGGAGYSQRAPLRQEMVRAAVVPGSRLWTAVRVVGQTGSTNEDLLAEARAGAPAGIVLVAEAQTRGRGRLDRGWQSQPRSALTFSALLRPAGVPAANRGWLPLLTGVAVALALRAQTGLDVRLKWPNDVLIGDAKLAGILAEQAGDVIVVGAGINVSQVQDELPSARATSLWLQGARSLDRLAILTAVLREFERWYLPWAAPEQRQDARGAAGQPGDAAATGLRSEYLRLCATIGRDVRVELPADGVLAGRACDIDGVGRLLVNAANGLQAVTAGDIIHVR
jgi:BirA family transcriptional regulator, biotin operon repressor / biotin---[acetyl-CoA-carboxylase] ligase